MFPDYWSCVEETDKSRKSGLLNNLDSSNDQIDSKLNKANEWARVLEKSNKQNLPHPR